MSASWRSSILCVARPCSATHQKDGDYVGDANREGPHGSQARVSVVRLERRVATRSFARAVSSSDPRPNEQNRKADIVTAGALRTFFAGCAFEFRWFRQASLRSDDMSCNVSAGSFRIGRIETACHMFQPRVLSAPPIQACLILWP